VPVNADEAVSWNRKSAESGDAWAQTKMGMRYLKGEGVEQDDADARKWLTLASEQGSKAATQKLAELDTNDLD
jgi:TPR repeat protein